MPSVVVVVFAPRLAVVVDSERGAEEIGAQLAGEAICLPRQFGGVRGDQVVGGR